MKRDKEKKWYQQDEFLKLQQEWYGKLKDSGWKEIEHFDWGNGGEVGNLLNGFSAMDAYRQWSPEQEEYFRLAVQYRRLVGQRAAKGYLEKWQVKAWTQHSNGKSYRQIQETLGVHRRHVAKYIKEEAQRMLAWARKQGE